MNYFAPASLGDLALRILLVPPDGDYSVTHRFDTIIGRGRTTIEERYPGRSALLLTQACTLTAWAAQLDDVRKGLAALGPTLVGMPLWADALPRERWAERIYEPLQLINFEPFTDSFALLAAADLPEDLSELAYSHLAPLLIGRFAARPTASALTSTAAELPLKLVEASPYSCRIGIHTYGTGWTAEPDWTDAPEETSLLDLETIALEGVAARETGLDAVNAAPQWQQTAGFTFADRLAIRTALTWFVAKQGATHSWSDLPAWLTPGEPSSVTPATYTVRFASDALTLDYLSSESASARLGFLQEIATPGRAQGLPAETYLYRLDYEHAPAAPELWTNWDAPLVGTEGTFAPAQLSHQEILLALRPQDVRVELSLLFAPGSLMDDWQRGRLFGSVTLSIWRCDPTDVAGTRGAPLFVGAVTNVLPDGNSLRVTAALLADLFGGRIAGWEYGPDCGTHLFSPECGLDEAAHLSTGTLAPADLSSDRLTVTVHGVTGWGGPAYADEWFAHGMIRTGTGRATQEITVTSSALVSGNLVLKLQRPMWADMIAGAGQAATIVPGCGLQYVADCIGKYGNGGNNRGDPFIPDYLEQVDSGATRTPKK